MSLRIPMGTIWIKLMYPLQALLVVVLFLKTTQPRYTYINTKDSRTLVVLLWLLLASVCFPFIKYSPDQGTINYTLVLFTWAITLSMIGRTFRLDIKSFVNVYCFSVFLLLALSLISFLFLDTGAKRISSAFGGGTNRLGLYSVIGMLISVYILSKNISIKHKYIYKIGLPLCLITFVLTFSRSAVLALGVAALEHGIRTKRIKLGHLALILAIVTAIVFYLNHMYITTGDEKYVKLMYRFRINDLLGHPYLGELTEVARSIHYTNAINQISASWNSLFFGLGLESYRSVDFLSNYRGKDLALHSMFLQYLMGGGLFALSCLLLFVSTIYFKILTFPQWQKDLVMFLFIPAVVHASFQPAIFSREILLYAPLLVFSCQLSMKTTKKNQAI